MVDSTGYVEREKRHVYKVKIKPRGMALMDLKIGSSRSTRLRDIGFDSRARQEKSWNEFFIHLRILKRPEEAKSRHRRCEVMINISMRKEQVRETSLCCSQISRIGIQS